MYVYSVSVFIAPGEGGEREAIGGHRGMRNYRWPQGIIGGPRELYVAPGGI